MNTNVEARRAYQRRMKQRQTVLFGSIGAIMAALVLLNTLFWTGLVPFPFFREFSREAAPTYTIPCIDAGTSPVDLASINARVFNASDTAGLAKEVTEKLQAQGVTVDVTGNWESDQQVKESTLLFTNTGTISQAYTLRAFFPGSKVVFDKTMSDGVVDVVLGDGWTEMAAAPNNKDFTAAMEPVEGCVDPN